MEVTNRFKGLDLIECLKNYRQRFLTLYRRQGSRASPRKRYNSIGGLSSREQLERQAEFHYSTQDEV